jgi:hypothetical protein
MAEELLNVISAIASDNSDTLDANVFEIVHDPSENRRTSDGQQSLVTVVGQRLHSPGETGSEDHRLQLTGAG